jgi:hypothetical protein
MDINFFPDIKEGPRAQLTGNNPSLQSSLDRFPYSLRGTVFIPLIYQIFEWVNEFRRVHSWSNQECTAPHPPPTFFQTSNQNLLYILHIFIYAYLRVCVCVDDEMLPSNYRDSGSFPRHTCKVS